MILFSALGRMRTKIYIKNNTQRTQKTVNRIISFGPDGFFFFFFFFSILDEFSPKRSIHRCVENNDNV